MDSVIYVILTAIILFVLSIWMWRLHRLSKTKGSKEIVYEKEGIQLTVEEPDHYQFELSKNKNGKENATLKNFDFPCNRLYITEFENYLRTEIKNIQKEHKSVPIHEVYSTIYSRLIQNKDKNRKLNYYAYDHSRVILENHNTDYIHANYIKSFNGIKKYIATQFPTTNTINDFWHMIWQNGIECIVVLLDITKNESKQYTQYWPNRNESITFENYQIVSTNVENHSYYCVNDLKIQLGQCSHTVKHFHFFDWPENNIPLYPNELLPFFEQIHGLKLNSFAVHCSSGEGNTGTFIMCDIALDMASETNSIDFLNILFQMRVQRIGMIGEYKQYLLAHYLVYQYLFAKDFTMTVQNISKQKVQKLILHNGINDIYNHINEIEWQTQILKLLTGNETKSLKKDLNWSFVETFESLNKFIVLKCPEHKDIQKFYKLILDYDVQVVVHLNSDERDMVKSTIWPKLNEKQYIPNIGTIECSSQNQKNLLIVKITNLTKVEKEIKFLKVKDWPVNYPVPNSIKVMEELQEEIYKLSTNVPTIVMCHDGITSCSLFLTSTFLFHKIQAENVVDIVLAIQQMRKNFENFNIKKEQIEFLYKFALEYLSTNVYSSV